MAYNATIPVPKRTWTRLSNGAVTALRAQLKSGDELALQITTADAEPADHEGVWTLYRRQTLPLDAPLSAIWSDAALPVYVWGYCLVDCIVDVAHA